MKSHARVVVIGGGVVGVGTLYHLAKKGWTDVTLIERRELTSGSTWHAAGLLPLFNLSYSVGQIHKYSVKLYESLEAETGQPVGFKKVSNIRLARTRDRWDEYMYYKGIADTIGVEVELLTATQVKDIWPLMETDGILGAIRHPGDGYIQPADLTQALAKGARQMGAEINRFTTVTGIEKTTSGEWRVKTDKGDITCEHVVCATGNFARKTGAMLGLDIPVIPVEHQYIVTEPHPAIQARHAAGLPEMGVLRESDSAWYMREEAGGLILGPYENGAPVCYVDGPDENSEYELFQEELDRLEPYIETAMMRVPAFGEVGIKKVYNGAIAYTPDGNPIVGPAWGLDNIWLNEGHSFGVTASGGAGWQLAEWIVEGEPTVDMSGVDPRRFGPYATRGYLKAKNEEAYRNVFTPHYPDEEREAARPLKTSPVYDRLKTLGGVFGSVYGWERANWFAPESYGFAPDDIEKPAVITNHNHPAPAGDGKVKEIWSFRRSNYFEHVGNEVKSLTNGVGIQDLTPFAKCLVSGQGARAWLDSILANKIPKRGRVALCHMLGLRGGVKAEFTLYESGPDVFYLVSAGALERHDHDLLRRLLPKDGSVTFRPITHTTGVLAVAGPASRELLQGITDTDLSTKAFPWLTGKKMSVGLVEVEALRVNFIGELGWELHVPIDMMATLFDTLTQAGAKYGIKPFGVRAMMSCAVEKSYRNMGRELSIEYAAYESGLDRFVHPNKGQFLGRDALVDWRQRGFANRFVTLELTDVTESDARGSEPILHNGKLVGRCTTGAYGWRTGKSLTMAMVRPDLGDIGTELDVVILGETLKAHVVGESPFDPENIRLRT